MAEEKITFKSGWFQFIVAQLVAFLVYSLGLAYWLGGFSANVDQLSKSTSTLEQRINDLDKYDTQPGRLSQQINAAQEVRITKLEDSMDVIRPQLAQIATQISNVDDKLDKVLKGQ